MSVRSSKAALAGIEKMAGASLGRVSRGYRSDIGPLIAALRSAKSTDGLKRALSPTLAKRMGTTAIADSLSETLTQAALIGKVAGTPKSKTDDKPTDRTSTEPPSSADRKRP